MGHAFFQRGTNAVLVADARQLGVAHHLRLEAIGQNVVNIMAHQVFGNRVDAVLCLQQVARGTVLLFDGQHVFGAALLEQVFKRRVKRVFFVQRRVGGFAFVQNLQCDFVIHRVHQPVGVDVLAKAFVRFAPGVPLCNQRGAGKGNARGIRKGFKQVVAQV